VFSLASCGKIPEPKEKVNPRNPEDKYLEFVLDPLLSVKIQNSDKQVQSKPSNESITVEAPPFRNYEEGLFLMYIADKGLASGKVAFRITERKATEEGRIKITAIYFQTGQDWSKAGYDGYWSRNVCFFYGNRYNSRCFN
jgi:hypothetical protein